MKNTCAELADFYRRGLLEDIVPFWFPHSVDQEHGGYFTCLNRDGSLMQSDKAVWFQGRMAWMLSTMYNDLERREQWLADARSGVEFLSRHCFDTDGRMFYSVTAEGRPLRKRRYLFSECFATIAFAAYGAASGETAYIEKAQDLFRMVLKYHRTPGLLEPKINPETRPSKGLSMPMILLVTAQELRKYSSLPLCDEVIADCITEIRRDYFKSEFSAVLETVGPNGEFLDTLDGRCLNPGHSIEVGWFILEEARVRGGDSDLLRLGTQIIDDSLKWGWDEEHGGIFYFRDVRHLPCTEYWHDMKFWWPHNEALIATLLAWELTGEERYMEWHERVREWTYAHFPDREHGEWYGYLHRDGSISTPVKGTMYKGFFHIPRMKLACWSILNRSL